MWKKRSSLCFILCLILGLCACTKQQVGTPEDNAVAQEDTQEAQEQYRFGFAAGTMEDSYTAILESSLRNYLQTAGHELVTKDAKGDVSLQAQQIDELIAEKVDVVYYDVIKEEAAREQLEKLYDAGIAVVNLGLPVEDSDVTAYVGVDDISMGKLCGNDLVERCTKGGKLLIIDDSASELISECLTGFEVEIANHGFEVIGRVDMATGSEEALEKCKELLKTKKITAIMCGSDTTALAVQNIITECNAEQGADEQIEVMLYSVDGSPEVKQELKEGTAMIVGTAARMPVEVGKEAGLVGVLIAEDLEYSEEIWIESFLITKENIDLYGVDGWQ